MNVWATEKAERHISDLEMRLTTVETERDAWKLQYEKARQAVKEAFDFYDHDDDEDW